MDVPEQKATRLDYVDMHNIGSTIQRQATLQMQVTNKQKVKSKPTQEEKWVSPP